MATIILNNATETAVLYNGADLSKVDYNGVTVWDKATANGGTSGGSTTDTTTANLNRILASSGTLMVGCADGTATKAISSTTGGGALTTGSASVTYYWSSDYSHLILEHPLFMTKVMTIDEALSYTSYIYLDPFSSVVDVQGATLADLKACVKPLNIYIDGTRTSVVANICDLDFDNTGVEIPMDGQVRIEFVESENLVYFRRYSDADGLLETKSVCAGYIIDSTCTEVNINFKA